MNPRVSICIPCFNAGRWITESVQSALDQTCPNKEIIVVDDGSTDDSLARLEAFGEGVRVIRGPHRGSNPVMPDPASFVRLGRKIRAQSLK